MQLLLRKIKTQQNKTTVILTGRIRHSLENLYQQIYAFEFEKRGYLRNT